MSASSFAFDGYKMKKKSIATHKPGGLLWRPMTSLARAIWGETMDSQAFTLTHVAISLIAILSGLVVAYGLLTAKKFEGWTLLFLVATVVTSVTGFFFHRDHILPSHIVGVISLLLLAGAIVARYSFRLRGSWRVVYVDCAVASLYLNVFVLIVQAFQKISFLHALAPTGSTEPAFVVVQGLVLVTFLVIGLRSVRRFRPRAFA